MTCPKIHTPDILIKPIIIITEMGSLLSAERGKALVIGGAWAGYLAYGLTVPYQITARVGGFSSSFTIYVEENITRFYGKDRYLTH